MVAEGARYWASRLEIDSVGAHLRNVIGPDEYHTHVADNFFTNLLAAWQLRKGAELFAWLGRRYPKKARELSAQLVSVRDWRALADQVVLNRDERGIWEQHDGFFDLEPVSLSAYSPRQLAMYDLLGAERIEHAQVVKQADVVMAMALLPNEVGSKRVRRANWDFYQPKCDHGSSLSMAVHARVASDLGLIDHGYRFLRGAMSIDLEDAMGNGRHGIHAATQGGVLQACLFGFAGLGLSRGKPVTRPRLPRHWKAFNFAFFYRGARHERELRQTEQKGG